jgi:hypothetical protein
MIISALHFELEFCTQKASVFQAFLLCSDALSAARFPKKAFRLPAGNDLLGFGD